MGTVVIIDDEPLVAEELPGMTAWERWNCLVAGRRGGYYNESILCGGLLSCEQSGGKYHIGTGHHEA